MTNGQNTWAVRFSQITWFERLLRTHGNVAAVSRRDDILFDVIRKKQRDQVVALCCEEYTAGITVVQRALAEFHRVDIVYIGGGWCGYTAQAKEFCVSNRIGIYVSDEMTGALWADDYWAYHKRDQKGDPIYYYRSA
jgi:hypothetical protein